MIFNVFVKISGNLNKNWYGLVVLYLYERDWFNFNFFLIDLNIDLVICFKMKFVFKLNRND